MTRSNNNALMARQSQNSQKTQNDEIGTHLVQKPMNFVSNAELGRTIENISKIEGNVENDNSEFLASYLGKDNRSQGRNKEQRAFSI